jgi:hypothetical protein
MLPTYYPGLRPDPITGRLLAGPCWNGFHEDDGTDHRDGSAVQCKREGCGCGCHPAPEAPEEFEGDDEWATT